MITYTDQFPGVTVIVRSAGLARYVSFEMSLEALNVPIGTHVARAITSNLAGSLNDCIRSGKSPFYWIIDDDHVCDNFMLLRLLAHNKPVVNAVTCMNKPPFHCVIYRSEIEAGEERWAKDFDERASETLKLIIAGSGGALDVALNQLRDLIRASGYQRKRKKYRTWTWKELDDKSGLFPVYACGVSGMLVKREVFDTLDDPWFELGRTNPEEIGEDTYFCEKLRASKFAIETPDGPCAAWVDLDLVFGHTAPAAAWPTRMENGAWTIRLQWENGANIVINRPDLPPVVVPSADEVAAVAGRGTSIVERAKALQASGLSEADAFTRAMQEAET